MLPCCASLNNENVSPFPWKDFDNRPSLRDTFSHIPLMEKYSIPYIADIHTHFFPEVIMKLIWKWFDKVNWEISYRKNELERVEILKKNKVKLYTTLNYAHKKDKEKESVGFTTRRINTDTPLVGENFIRLYEISDVIYEAT
jgi:hypothetical protein